MVEAQLVLLDLLLAQLRLAGKKVDVELLAWHLATDHLDVGDADIGCRQEGAYLLLGDRIMQTVDGKIRCQGRDFIHDD